MKDICITMLIIRYCEVKLNVNLKRLDPVLIDGRIRIPVHLIGSDPGILHLDPQPCPAGKGKRACY